MYSTCSTQNRNDVWTFFIVNKKDVIRGITNRGQGFSVRSYLNYLLNMTIFIKETTMTYMKSLLQVILEARKTIQGLNGYEYDEAVDIIKDSIDSILEEAELTDEIEVIEIWLHGSRLRGTAKHTSDLDAVLFYKGNMKEDSLFNILHDSEICIDGIEVDVNPIKVHNAQEIDSYKKKSIMYDEQVLKSIKDAK